VGKRVRVPALGKPTVSKKENVALWPKGGVRPGKKGRKKLTSPHTGPRGGGGRLWKKSLRDRGACERQEAHSEKKEGRLNGGDFMPPTGKKSSGITGEGKKEALRTDVRSPEK